MQIGIVYDSGYGHTARLAEAVAEGAQRLPGTQTHLVAVREDNAPWGVLEACDAIIFGSPTYNGMISARLKQFFEDATKPVWNDMKWRNKLAAGFTNSGAHSGDKLNALVSMALLAAQHGMVWVGLDLKPGNSASTGSSADLNRLGSWIGVMAQANVDEGPDLAPPGSDLQTAAYLGERVAQLTARFQAGGA